MRVSRISVDDIDIAAPLFADYLTFYGAPYDSGAATAFLTERVATGESLVFVAIDGSDAVGFAQIYPSFSSVRLAPIWILNDLFVAEAARGGRAVDLLLDTIAAQAEVAGAIAVELSTEHTNQRAQAVYRRHGYTLDETFQHYEKTLP